MHSEVTGADIYDSLTITCTCGAVISASGVGTCPDGGFKVRTHRVKDSWDITWPWRRSMVLAGIQCGAFSFQNSSLLLFCYCYV